jgi:dihydroneopterin aldolase
MYTIYIEDFKIEAIIGILDHERVAPQPITIACKIEYIKEKEQFINYADITYIIEKMLIEHKYALIEEALDEIMEALIREFGQIKSIQLKILKPKILTNCIVGVEAFRKI